MDSKAIALHLAESIDISGCRQAMDKELVYGDRDELFYSDGTLGYLYIFKYGIVSFYGFDETAISKAAVPEPVIKTAEYSFSILKAFKSFFRIAPIRLENSGSR